MSPPQLEEIEQSLGRRILGANHHCRRSTPARLGRAGTNVGRTKRDAHIGRILIFLRGIRTRCESLHPTVLI